MSPQTVAFTLILYFCINVLHGQEKIILFTASSMTEAIHHAGKIYEKEKNVRVLLNIASSGTLARQIEFGAPADIFISASSQWMTQLNQKKRIIQSKPFLHNRLVVISRTPLTIKNLSTFLKYYKGKIAMGHPEHVPGGMYAKAGLQKLKCWKRIQPQLILAKNVRFAQQIVETGGADIGIVYQTDALASKKVYSHDVIPSAAQSNITYHVALCNDKKQTKDFIHFLSSRTMQKQFKKYGFTLPVKKVVQQ